ncbi:MAG: hypothetical protein WC476_01160 [Phycisphaerae bacterium]|jgi:hypothetical protein
MTKPTRIKSTAVGVKANDHQIHRLQNIGMTAGLNPTQVKEIGNAGITEVVDGIPTVDVTMDKNQNGSIRAICLFADTVFDYSYAQVTPATGLTVNMGTSGDSYYIDEMKYICSGGTINLTSFVPGSDSRIVVVALDASQAVQLTSGSAAAVPTAPTSSAGCVKVAEVYLTNGQTIIEDKHVFNCGDYVTITDKDFENASADVIVGIKEVGDSETSDPITRTAYMENAFLNRLEIACNTGGVSTENMAAETDNRKWLFDTKRAVIDDRFKGAATHILTYTPTTLTNGNKALKVRVYDYSADVYVDKVEGTDFTISGSTLTWVTTAPDAADTSIVRYCADQDISEVFKKFPNPDVSHPDFPAALQQGNIEIYLSDDSANQVLRIQSCTISLGLTREALNEIGHERPYARPLTLPITVTVTLNTTASDLAELARLCGKTLATASELDLGDFIKTLTLYVYFYRENDIKRAEAPYSFYPYLKKITCTDLSVSSDAFDLRVDANATQNYTLTCDNISIVSCI